MKKTFLIFDVDGTLVYSNKIDSQCFAQTYEAIYERPFPTIDWRQYPHVTDTTIFSTVIRQHFGRETSAAEVRLFQDHFVALLEHQRQVTPEEFKEVPQARSAIERLLDDPRFTVGIGTGGWLRPATMKLRYVGIPTERLIFSAADGMETREGIIQRAMSEAGEFQRAVYIGDAIWDVHTTRRMGMDFVGIRWKGDLEALQCEGADTVLRDYADYEGFVEAIFSARPPK